MYMYRVREVIASDRSAHSLTFQSLWQYDMQFVISYNFHVAVVQSRVACELCIMCLCTRKL